jgi:hypothetical protein
MALKKGLSPVYELLTLALERLEAYFTLISGRGHKILPIHKFVRG